jgi:hypothetical protein
MTQFYVGGTTAGQRLMLGYDTTNNYGMIAALGAGAWQNLYLQPNSANGVPNVTIQAGGNVGIGTTAPGQTLEVNGNISAKNGYALYYASGVLSGYVGPGADVFTSGPTASADLGMRSATGNLGFAANSTTPQMILTSSGSVGIGTTEPAVGGLDVWGRVRAGEATSDWAYLSSPSIAADTSIYSYGYICAGEGSGGCTAAGGTGVVLASTGSNVYGSVYLTGVGNTYFNGGNVGIGTTTPAAALQVGNGYASTVLAVAPYGTVGTSQTLYGTSLLGLNLAGTGTGSYVANGDGAHNGGAAVLGDVVGNIWFATAPSTGTAAQTLTAANVVNDIRMEISSSGLVGIGTTSPQATLQVNGNEYVNRAVTDFSFSEELSVGGPIGAYSSTSSAALFLGNDVTGLSTLEKFYYWTGSGWSNAGTISTNGGDLELGINGTTYETVSTTGLVGIGTTLPYTTLDVNGVIAADGSATITSSPPSVGTGVGWKLGLYANNYAIGVATDTLAVKTGQWFSIFGGNPSGNATSTTPDTGAVVSFNAGNGNGVFTGSVGIGTTSPQSKLHIQAGEVQTGTSGGACAAANQGAIRYASGILYFCDNASTWETIDSSGSSGGGSGDWEEVTQAAPTPTGTSQGYFGASTTLGAILSGDGSTSDVTLENKSGSTVLEIPTGTLTAQFLGNVAVGGSGFVANSLLTANTNIPDPSASAYGGYFARNVTLGTSNANVIYGVFGQADHPSGVYNETGSFIGGHFEVDSNSTATDSNDKAIDALVYNTAAGTVTNGIAANLVLQNLNASGVITNAYGAKVSLGFNSGTITNTYGVYVSGMAIGTQTNTPYDIYAGDSGAYNYFGGNVGIGTANPGALLDIERTANDGGTILQLGNGDAPAAAFDFARSSTTGALSIQGNQSGYNNILLAPAGGNVGIGTTVPGALLTVGANAFEVNSSGTVTAGDYTSAGITYIDSTSNQIQIRDTSGLVLLVNSSGAQMYGSTNFLWTTDGGGNIGASGANRPNNLYLANNAIVSGAVGIGTASPQSKLHIQGGEVQVGSSGVSCAAANAGAIRYASGTLYYCDNASTWETLDSSGGGNAGDWEEVTQTAPNPSGTSQGYFGASTTLGAVLSGDGSTSDLTLENHSGSAALEIPSGTTNLYAPGSVGIGVATPLTTLHITGNEGMYSSGASSSGSPVAASLYLGDSNFASSGFYNSAPGLSAVYDPGSAVGGALAFYYYGGVSNARSEAMRITYPGKVGIGTTTPGALFTVGSNAFEVNSSGDVMATNSGFGCNTSIAAATATNATNATSATDVATTSTSSSGTYYPLFVASSSNSNQAADLSTLYTVNPSSGGVTSGGAVAIGTTSTDGLKLINSTAATSTLTQFSPRVHFEGQGWKTNATAGSQAVDFIEEVQPVQGTSAPTGNLVWSNAINGGSYGALMTLTSGGLVGIGTTSPQSKLHIQGGEVQVGSSGVSCAPPMRARYAMPPAPSITAIAPAHGKRSTARAPATTVTGKK